MRAVNEGRVDLDDLELLYVDDGSSDDTATVASSLIEQIPHGRVLPQGRNRGKGAAVRAGVAAATSELLVFTDADLAIDPRQLPSLLEALDEAPIAVGSRAVRGRIDYGSPLRTFAGRTFNLMVRRLSSVELYDTQCGWKGVRSAHAKLLFHLTAIEGFAFDVELLARATELSLPISEVPVSWSDVGGSHVRLVRDSSQMLRDLVAARLRSGGPPHLYGLTLSSPGAPESLFDAAAPLGLAAQPVLVGVNGEVTLAATLLNPADALESLEGLRLQIGGVVAPLTMDEIRSARSISLVSSNS